MKKRRNLLWKMLAKLRLSGAGGKHRSRRGEPHRKRKHKGKDF